MQRMLSACTAARLKPHCPRGIMMCTDAPCGGAGGFAVARRPAGRGRLGGLAAGGTSKGGAEVKPTRMDEDVGELSTGVWYMNMCICEAM